MFVVVLLNLLEANVVLVAGGAGFIGSHVVDLLLENGYKVVVLDDLSSGRFENLSHHLKKINFKFIEGSILDLKMIEEAVDGVDAIVDMVGKGDLARSIENPLLYHEVNLTGTLNLLTVAVKKKIKKFIFASSGAVYTSKAIGLFSEESPYGPISPYAATKVGAEIYCQTFHTVYALETVTLRFFNVYGPRRENSSYGGAVTHFILNVMNGKPVTLYGSGEDQRDYVYVKDVAKAVMLALKPGIFGSFNVGTGVGTTTNALLAKIENISCARALIIEASARNGDSPSRIADIQKSNILLGFQPDYNLEEGLAELYEYLQH